MGIDVKILDKILTNQIQQYIETYTVIKWHLFKGCKDSLILANQCDIPH